MREVGDDIVKISLPKKNMREVGDGIINVNMEVLFSAGLGEDGQRTQRYSQDRGGREETHGGRVLDYVLFMYTCRLVLQVVFMYTCRLE
jgi:hypothetical protein